MIFKRKLPIPQEVKAEFPLSAELAAVKAKNDEEVRKIFTGESNKFLLVIGPCSADREDAVMEYIYRLKKLSEQVDDKLLIIPRVYTGKPRTTGEGYKGLVHQPNPNEPPDMLKGLISIRKIQKTSPLFYARGGHHPKSERSYGYDPGSHRADSYHSRRPELGQHRSVPI